MILSRTPLRSVTLIATAVATVVSACGSSGGSSDGGAGASTASASATPNPYNPVYGLDIGLHQTTSVTAPVTDDHIRQVLGALQGRTTWVRFVGTTGEGKRAAHIAKQLGFKVALASYYGGDPTHDQAETNQLMASFDAGDVDLAIAGSESIHEKHLTQPQLIAYITQVRTHVHGAIQVTTVEPDKEMLQNTQLIDAEDAVMVNIPPISYGIPIDKTLAYVQTTYSQLVAVAKGKPVIIGETEWPSDGGPDWPVATPTNAARYFNDIENWARPANVPVFYFEAVDEPYLGQFNDIGPHWGIFTADLVLKPGMAPVFQR